MDLPFHDYPGDDIVTQAIAETREAERAEPQTSYDYDLLVIGSGPAGERAALQAAKLGKRAAVIERRAGVGGVMVHTGTLPSKTLRETVLYIAGLKQRSVYGMRFEMNQRLTVRQLMHRKENVIQREMEVIADQLQRNGVETISGFGVLTSPHRALVSSSSDSNRVISANKIVISVGTRPHHPDNIPIDHKFIYDGESILDLDEIPRTLTIVGGGVIGCEYASIFSHLGIKVTLLDREERLLSFTDREISDTLIYLLRKNRVRMILGDQVDTVRIVDGKVWMDTKCGRHIISDKMLVSAGRQGNTNNLGLEALGIETNSRGLIKVDEHFRTSCQNVYAVGDVIGFPSLASVSMDQGRLASYHAFCMEDNTLPMRSMNSLLPYGIYTIPEVSLVGETEESARDKGEEFEVGISRFHELARGQIVNDHDGLLKIIFRRSDKRVLGVHIIGERATELIHIGQAVMSYGGTIDYFVDTVFNYPTLSEAYKVAALDGLARLG